MFVTPLPTNTRASPEQLRNARDGMSATLSGIVTLSSASQP